MKHIRLLYWQFGIYHCCEWLMLMMWTRKYGWSAEKKIQMIHLMTNRISVRRIHLREIETERKKNLLNEWRWIWSRKLGLSYFVWNDWMLGSWYRTNGIHFFFIKNYLLFTVFFVLIFIVSAVNFRMKMLNCDNSDDCVFLRCSSHAVCLLNVPILCFVTCSCHCK